MRSVPEDKVGSKPEEGMGSEPKGEANATDRMDGEIGTTMLGSEPRVYGIGSKVVCWGPRFKGKLVSVAERVGIGSRAFCPKFLILHHNLQHHSTNIKLFPFYTPTTLLTLHTKFSPL